jgi:hypothetical protein
MVYTHVLNQGALQPVLEFESEEAAGVAALLASMKSGA